jgi:hypothetical protein
MKCRIDRQVASSAMDGDNHGKFQALWERSNRRVLLHREWHISNHVSLDFPERLAK